MPMPIKTWIKQAKKETIEKDMEEMSTVHFFRNPVRAMPATRQFVFTPADGFITLQGRFDPESDLVDIKGVHITINNLLGPHAVDSPCLVIAVFMSFLDVHWNRAPTEAVMTRHAMPPVRTANVPMLWEERDILKDLHLRSADMQFMAVNQRVVNVFYAPHMKYTYYVVQIADSDVSMIVPVKATSPINLYNQNERFGQILWGSMCVLVMPLDERYKFKPVCKVNDHVECCHDPLVELTKMRKS